jgi:hypothetical protein
VSDAIWVALIASVIGPVVVARLARHGTKREISRELEQRVGTPNGKGNVVEMLERLLTGQTGQDNRLARIEARQIDHEARIRAIEARNPEGDNR